MSSKLALSIITAANEKTLCLKDLYLAPGASIYELLFMEVLHSWTKVKGWSSRKQPKGQGKDPAEETDVHSSLFIFGTHSDTINIVPETLLSPVNNSWLFLYSKMSEYLNRSTLLPYSNWKYSSNQSKFLAL